MRVFGNAFAMVTAGQHRSGKIVQANHEIPGCTYIELGVECCGYYASYRRGRARRSSVGVSLLLTSSRPALDGPGRACGSPLVCRS
jgi:hypothetical protein